MSGQEFMIWICVFVCVIGTFVVTWLVQRMRERKKRREIILDCIANNSDLLVLIYMPKKKCVEFVSDSVSWLFGIDKKRVYQDVGHLFDAMSLSREDDIVQNFYQGNIKLSDQMEYTIGNYHDGRRRWIMVRTAPCGNGREVLTVSDVTAEHELIRVFCMLLKEVKEGRESEQMLLSYVGDHIQHRVHEMSKFYQEFMDMIHGVVVTDGHSDNKDAVFHMEQLIKDISDSYRKMAGSRGQQFEMKCRTTHNWVTGDQEKLKKVIQNLLENAIVYTPDGGKITLEVEEEEPVRNVGKSREVGFTIVVEDTGIGIPEEFIPKLFQPFERADDPRVRKVGGRGLGLVLVTNIVDWMDGSIQVESQMEQGSRFIVKLNFALSDVEQASLQN